MNTDTESLLIRKTDQAAPESTQEADDWGLFDEVSPDQTEVPSQSILQGSRLGPILAGTADVPEWLEFSQPAEAAVAPSLIGSQEVERAIAPRKAPLLKEETTASAMDAHHASPDDSVPSLNQRSVSAESGETEEHESAEDEADEVLAFAAMPGIENPPSGPEFQPPDAPSERNELDDEVLSLAAFPEPVGKAAHLHGETPISSDDTSALTQQTPEKSTSAVDHDHTPSVQEHSKLGSSSENEGEDWALDLQGTIAESWTEGAESPWSGKENKVMESGWEPETGSLNTEHAASGFSSLKPETEPEAPKQELASGDAEDEALPQAEDVSFVQQSDRNTEASAEGPLSPQSSDAFLQEDLVASPCTLETLEDADTETRQELTPAFDSTEPITSAGQVTESEAPGSIDTVDESIEVSELTLVPEPEETIGLPAEETGPDQQSWREAHGATIPEPVDVPHHKEWTESETETEPVLGEDPTGRPLAETSPEAETSAEVEPKSVEEAFLKPSSVVPDQSRIDTETSIQAEPVPAETPEPLPAWELFVTQVQQPFVVSRESLKQAVLSSACGEIFGRAMAETEPVSESITAASEAIPRMAEGETDDVNSSVAVESSPQAQEADEMEMDRPPMSQAAETFPQPGDDVVASDGEEWGLFPENNGTPFAVSGKLDFSAKASAHATNPANTDTGWELFAPAFPASVPDSRSVTEPSVSAKEEFTSKVVPRTDAEQASPELEEQTAAKEKSPHDEVRVQSNTVRFADVKPFHREWSRSEDGVDQAWGLFPENVPSPFHASGHDSLSSPVNAGGEVWGQVWGDTTESGATSPKPVHPERNAPELETEASPKRTVPVVPTKSEGSLASNSTLAVPDPDAKETAIAEWEALDELWGELLLMQLRLSRADGQSGMGLVAPHLRQILLRIPNHQAGPILNVFWVRIGLHQVAIPRSLVLKTHSESTIAEMKQRTQFGMHFAERKGMWLPLMLASEWEAWIPIAANLELESIESRSARVWLEVGEPDHPYFLEVEHLAGHGVVAVEQDPVGDFLLARRSDQPAYVFDPLKFQGKTDPHRELVKEWRAGQHPVSYLICGKGRPTAVAIPIEHVLQVRPFVAQSAEDFPTRIDFRGKSVPVVRPDAFGRFHADQPAFLVILRRGRDVQALVLSGKMDTLTRDFGSEPLSPEADSGGAPSSDTEAPPVWTLVPSAELSSQLATGLGTGS